MNFESRRLMVSGHILKIKFEDGPYRFRDFCSDIILSNMVVKSG